MFFGGALTCSHTKSKTVFSKSNEKAPHHCPTKEEGSYNSDDSMNTDGYGGQFTEEIGDSQTFMINFSQSQLSGIVFLLWFTVELDVLQFQETRYLSLTFIRELPWELS